jgi:hypothetical protein
MLDARPCGGDVVREGAVTQFIGVSGRDRRSWMQTRGATWCQHDDGRKDVIIQVHVCGRYCNVMCNCFLLIVEGTVQKQSAIINVLADAAVGM